MQMTSSSRGPCPMIEILFQGSKMLLYPNVTAATAITYRHKYNGVMKSKRPSENTYDSIMLCSAILFLAGKSTENIRRIREVLNVVRHLYGFKSELLELRKYQDMKNSVVEQEHFLLRVIGFSTSSDVPHSHLLNIARYLRIGNEEIKYAWMFLNDSFFDRTIISTPPAVIACSCIYLGIKASVLSTTRKKTFPSENCADSDHKWWTKLAVSDDILFFTCDWITKVSLQRMISCSI